MRAHHLLSLCLLLVACYAGAQVGVEVGVTSGVGAGAIDPLRRLGSAISRSVSGSTEALPGASAIALPPPSYFSIGPGATFGSRSFVPRISGGYVAGASWHAPGDVPVILKAGDQEAAGTTGTPVVVHFQAPAARLCTVSVRPAGDMPVGGLAGELDFVREVLPGEAPSKSLLTPDQRLAELTRKGPLPSVLPLLANLAERRLRGTQPATDLDTLFAQQVTATGVTAADLETLVREYEALPEAVKARSFTARSLGLRILADPTLAAVRPVFAPSGFGANYGGGGAIPLLTGLEPAVAAGGAYAPGATVRITGDNFAAQPDLNEVYLYPEVAGAYATRPLPVTSATATALVFQVPADLPEGRYRVSVNADRKSGSLAGLLQVKRGGSAGLADQPPAGPPGHYRLSALRLECVDESNPEWWGNDDVVLLLTGVGDGQAVTRAVGPFRDLADGAAQPMPDADQTLLGGMEIAQGMGVAVELWRWNPPAPAAGVATWALRESLANALVSGDPRFTQPKRQEQVAAELAVHADPVGYQQLTWTASELGKLLQPRQKLEKTLELRQGDKPEQYDSTGAYRLTLELARLD